MPKKILFIENDSAYAAGISESLEAVGFEVRVTPDGKEGLELAREWSPQGIILCVELPGMSGYLVCQKLKKDDGLKAIPLVLTSAEATEETFEKHRTLKARADEYLLKPYVPAALLEKLEALVGLPEGVSLEEEPIAEEELVSLEEELGLEATADGEPGEEVPGLDLQSLPDELPPSGGALGGDDEDLRLLDDAFDGIAVPPATEDAATALDELTGETPMAADEVDAAAASLPEEDEGEARADLGALDADADGALGALDDPDETLSPALGLGPARPARGGSTALLRDDETDLLEPPERETSISPADRREVERLERELADARASLQSAQRELGSREAELEDLRGKAEDLSGQLDAVEAEADRLRGDLEAATARAREAEEEARRSSDHARATEAELTALRDTLSEAERRADAAEDEARRRSEEASAAAEAIAKAEVLEREADELRTELLVARGEAEGARGEVERRTADLKRRLQEVEAASAKNEERVVKAYQKIKADEKVREKVRKALAIATQLLEEGLPAEPAPEKERRAAPVGRE